MRSIRSLIVVLGLGLVSVQIAGCGSASPSNPSTGAKVTGAGGNGAGAAAGNASNAGTGAGFNVGTGGSSSDPCKGANPPVNCGMTAPPGCGDGKINQPSEKCDDHNTLAGDGCNGVCQVEPNYICPTEGQPCIVSYTCGDGVINPGEVCDQGQYKSSPGCSADCTKQDKGYKCLPGQQCVALFSCGNGRIETGETCDPPNVGNGCGATCQFETGWRCTPGKCTRLPYCGDGIVQTGLGEMCDQGTHQGSPGCSADCKTVAPFCTCSPGQACVCQPPVCGDGIVQVGEQCDDKNSVYPGCSATCQLEPGYKCPFAGAPCVPVCGDGILVAPAEQCDPGITGTAQACNADCSVKPGWVCNASGCTQTVCGNGVVEGTEGCDPTTKNNDLGDGCTANCVAEPTCPAGTPSNPGGACTTKCGDGLVLGAEQCDDGNAVSGDGCSSTCQLEAGFTCTQPPLGDTMVVPMVVRDFNQGGDFEKAAAFATGLDYANQGLLQGTLDTQGLKPVLLSPLGTYNGVAGKDSGIANVASFSQWYNDAANVPTAAGPNAYHGTIGTSLNLYLITGSNPPTYVNRFGVNGNGLTSAQYLRTHTNQCGTTNQSNHDAAGNPIPCTACYYNANDPLNLTPCSQIDTTPCQTDATYTGQCAVNGNAWIGTFLDAAFDGNPLFFPADAFPKPWSPEHTGQISGIFNPSWPVTPETHNFSFTTEVRFWFNYDSTITYKLSFLGDDDVWVFVNKRLAVDIGGIHGAVKGVLTLSNGTASVVVTNQSTTSPIVNITSTPNLGTLQNGSVYEIAVFQAERQTTASNYQLTLSGFNAAHSVCKPECGGANPGVSPGEQCDNGTAGNCDPTITDCYNQCTTSCTLGPRCGDAILQSVNREECDNGTNTDGYAAAKSNACGPSCKLPPFCGDSVIQQGYGEECDNGAANSDTLYNGCTTTCTLGPSCGDGVTNGDAANPEYCDDGINDGTYGTCSPGCTKPPGCGDGIVQADWGEQCEPSLDPTCTAACQLPGACGDAQVQTSLGEVCDYGAALNTGAYGGCNSNCTPADYCGDGVKNGPGAYTDANGNAVPAAEECDNGDPKNNPALGGGDGSYGGCTHECRLGPHCGDHITNGPEECDDGTGDGTTTGNGSATSRCTIACKNFVTGPGT